MCNNYFCNIPDCANKIVLNGGVNVFGNYLKPLSTLTEKEVEELCKLYGYDNDVVELIVDFWLGPIIGIEPALDDGASIMSNGLTREQNEAILSGVRAAEVKSGLLKQLGR